MLKLANNMEFERLTQHRELSLKALFAYSITDLRNMKEKYVDRKPRRDSKWWDTTRFLIWDNKNNCEVLCS